MKILITHQKGGVGKTTITVALAHFFVSQKLSVAVIDFDAQGSLYQFKKIYENIGINVYLVNDLKEIDDLKEDIIIMDTPPYIFEYIDKLVNSVDLILIPLRPNVLDLMAVNRTLDIINENKLQDKTCIILNMVLNTKGREETNIEARSEIKKATNIYLLNNQFDLSVQFERLVMGNYEIKVKEQVEKVMKEILDFLKRNKEIKK